MKNNWLPPVCWHCLPLHAAIGRIAVPPRPIPRNRLPPLQAQATDTAALGPEMLRTYEGLLPAADGPGIRYELTLENREHSGDGTYRLP